MADVIDLKSRRPDIDVWQCQCGAYAFWLYSDGRAVCFDCGRECLSMQGYWTKPAHPEEKVRNQEMDAFEKRYPHLKWNWLRRKWFLFCYDIAMAISYLRTRWPQLVEAARAKFLKTPNT